MRITTLLIGIQACFATLLMASSSTAQNINLDVQQTNIKQVFLSIEKQANVSFVYNEKTLQGLNNITIKVTNKPLAEVLKQLSNQLPLEFKQAGTVIGVSITKPKLPAKEPQQQKTADINAPPLIIKGKVINEKGAALIGATVKVKNSATATTTNDEGNFQILLKGDYGVLIVSFVGCKTKEIPVSFNSEPLEITLQVDSGQLKEVKILSNGYQDIPQERATGSFNFVDNKLINRSVSTNILDRIENVVPGLLFNHGDAGNTDQLLIRSRSTIYANAAPLIVLDNFAYDGQLSNINPNDVESITILKDAAAASIWGARAGNGVIIITTKKGKAAKPLVELNSNITVQQKPDLFNIPTISSSDFIDLEKYLYKQGFYASTLNDLNNPAITPVISLLNAKANGTIPGAQADAEIESYKKQDVRNDIGKYLYQKAVNQQYALNVSGKTPNVNYFMSAGWDKNIANLVDKQLSRFTLRTENIFTVTKNLQITAGMNFVQNTSSNGNNPGYNIVGFRGQNIYPYAQLADAKGSSLPVSLDYSSSLLQKAAQQGLLNWSYNPIDDIREEQNVIKSRDYTINTGLSYKIFNGLSAEAKYQFEDQLTTNNNLYRDSSYYTRNLINQFTQVDLATGALTYPIPMGGILNTGTSESISHQGRAQLNYNRTFNQAHNLTAIAGYEIRELTIKGTSDRLYGYNTGNSTVNTMIDYTTNYQYYNSPFQQSSITSGQLISETTDRFLSYYANAAYTYDNRFTISGSARNDQANLFGVKTNQKGTPLWSAGASWEVNNESFYKIAWLPSLKLRVTYGANGNISRLTSAYTTVSYSEALQTPLLAGTILNPPNPNLRWEQVKVLNAGIDFSTKNNVLSGSVEFYQKKAIDLMGQAPVDPTLGLSDYFGTSVYYGNVAVMKGNGTDIQLTSRNLSGKFKWTTDAIYSYANSKITKYLIPASSQGSTYLTPIGAYYINPVQGNPVFSVYSYKWAGLNHDTGDPQGLLNGQASVDYAKLAQLPLDSMKYNGSAQPTSFGSVRNTFTYKNLSLSVNISYKLGYYFRMPSVVYGSLLYSWTGNSDYAKRWQKPGDEKTTNVPSFIYPNNSLRDIFYTYSDALVAKADNIRLEDVSITYNVNKSQWHKMPFNNIRFYFYAANLGVLWVANKQGIDPYYVGIPKEGKRFSLGVNLSF